MLYRRIAQTFVVLCVAGVQPAFAAPILTDAYEAQLEAWLGQGDLVFSNIYTKLPGQTSSDFHAAVDHRGATFTLFEAFYKESYHIVGGFNPNSWTSSGLYHVTHTDAERTAFIYNLTTSVKQDQRLTSDPYGAAYGQWQTFNHVTYGPTFGVGDIYVGEDLVIGDASQFSYGVGTCGATGGATVLSTTACGGFNTFTVRDLETYSFVTVQATEVPEPASMLLLGGGLLGGALQRRHRKTRHPS